MFSERDQVRLQSVHPTLVAKLSVVFDQMAKAGTPMFVVQGVRTTAQQQADYAQGRTLPGKIITQINGTTEKGPHQVHPDGFGYAVDCAFQATPTRAPYDPEWPWADYGDLVENQGLLWGGRFSFGDLDHAELPASTGLVA